MLHKMSLERESTTDCDLIFESSRGFPCDVGRSSIYANTLAGSQSTGTFFYCDAAEESRSFVIIWLSFNHLLRGDKYRSYGRLIASNCYGHGNSVELALIQDNFSTTFL